MRIAEGNGARAEREECARIAARLIGGMGGVAQAIRARGESADRSAEGATPPIAAALAAEREMAAVFMCGACRRGHERHVSADGAQLVHHLNDGMQARGEPYRVVACGASAYLRLRAAGPPPPAAGGARATEA